MVKNIAFFLSFSLFFGLIFDDAQAHIVINEILYNPASLNNREEFLELYNSDSNAVDLTGWSIQKGIQFQFPSGIQIPGGGFLVISPSPDVFHQIYPHQDAIGPYKGHLSNDGESIDLVDNRGILVDRVLYADEQGWPQEADGYGPSLERIHFEMPGSRPESWRAGSTGGTPGVWNENSIQKPVPIVYNVRQTPTVPSSSQSVQITCQVIHVRPIEKVILWYKLESGLNYETVELRDDGMSGDGIALDGIYGTSILPQPNGTIVEFAIEASAPEAERGWFPLGGLQQSAIYLVDDSIYEPPFPLYRIVMRKADENTLRSRSASSNVELPASFIYRDEIWYNVGLRFRGKGSRGREPKSYRVNFTNVRYMGSIRKLNLNAIEVYHQFVGLECFKFLHMPCPEKQFVSLAFNQVFIPNYIQVERTDQYMMARLFGDGSGNVYRGIEHGDFDYRGEDFNRYRANYEKQTNEREGDYSDIVRLCYAFSNTSDEEFVEALSREINIQQWVRWFAIKEILNDREGGIYLDRGDDYYIYRKPLDGLFYLLPWDMDTVLVTPIDSIHQHRIPAIQRLLRHPDLARFYYAELYNILENELTQPVMDSIIEQTALAATEKKIEEMKKNSRDSRAHIYASIPHSLSIQPNEEIVKALVWESDIWRFYRGISPLSPEWNQPGFDDSGWESGPGGFGYADNDDRTVLEDMQGHYSSVFIRKMFQVSDPSNLGKLVLTALVDDGFVAYINGVEVAGYNVSGNPEYDSFAENSSEANNPLVYEIPDPAAFLKAGDNVLAVVGLNNSLNSSDLSLAIRLEGVFLQNDVTKLQGLADAIHTRWIRVNGILADFQPWLATWSHAIELKPGRNLFTIEALDVAGQVFETTRTALYLGQRPPSDSRETIGDEIWKNQDNPKLVNQTIIVHPSDTLTIQPGVTVRLGASAGIVIYGTLTVEGNPDAPVRFLAWEGERKWGAIVADRSVGRITIRNASITQSGTFEFRGKQYNAAIHISSSTVDILDSRIAVDGAGIEAQSSFLTIRNNHFSRMGEMVHCTRCWAAIENNVFERTIGYSDAIDFDGELGSGSVIRGNRFIGSDDDAIDMGNASPLIERNWIENCFNKGISLEGISKPSMVNNVIVGCDIGIAVKDSCHAWIAHTTIVNCTSGVSIHEKIAGQGGGQAEIVNTVIWNTKNSLLVDRLSSAQVRGSDLMQLLDKYKGTNISLDPQFTDSSQYNFLPAPESPLIDAGVDTEIPADFLGLSRPQGSAPDIGAFEVQQNTLIEEWNLF